MPSFASTMARTELGWASSSEICALTPALVSVSIIWVDFLKVRRNAETSAVVGQKADEGKTLFDFCFSHSRTFLLRHS
jgi:hypothetical protein